MTEHPIPAMLELRQSLREAATRDIAARAPKRWRRFLTVGVVGLLLGGAAAAGAADLISAGEPLKSPYKQAERYNPQSALQIAVKASDDPLPWGVAIYDGRHGQKCALAGQVRGAQLGLMSGGKFHPYGPDHPAACGKPDKVGAGFFTDLLGTYPGRTIVYGRAKPGVKALYVVADGERFKALTGSGGAFVLVFKGERVRLSDITAA